MIGNLGNSTCKEEERRNQESERINKKYKSYSVNINFLKV